MEVKWKNGISILAFLVLFIIYLYLIYNYIVVVQKESWFWFLLLICLSLIFLWDKADWAERAAFLLFFIFAIFFLGLGVSGLGGDASKIEQENENISKNIINDIEIILAGLGPKDDLFKQCEKLSDNNTISIRGTRLIWDIRQGTIYAPKYTTIFLNTGYVSYIPPSIFDSRIIPYINFSDVTFFLIDTQKLDYTGSFYHESNVLNTKLETRAYRGKFNVCAVHWPSKIPIGMHTITNSPPGVVTVNRLTPYLQSEIIGNINEVFEWIGNIPSNR